MAINMLSPLPGFTIGADPELFLVDGGGTIISADGLIPGTKENPFLVEGGAVQVDGMAAEFNIDPSSTYDEFSGNIDKVMKELKAMLPKDVNFLIKPAVTFSEEVWDKASPESKLLGCSPDFNAWTGSMNPPPDGDALLRTRTASGHLHFGWTEDEAVDDQLHVKNCQDLVKQLDWYLGYWSLLKDPNKTRRALYGKAGACRFKSYGVEYRVLSNFWLKDKTVRRQVWNRAMMALADMRSSFMPDRMSSYSTYLVTSIDTSSRNTGLEDQCQYPLIRLK